MADSDFKPARVHGVRRTLLKAAAGLGTHAALRGLGLAGAAAAVSRSAQAQADRVFKIGYQKYGNLIVLKARGTLETRLAPLGFGVQWHEFPGGPQLLEGLNAGAVDFGVVGETPPIFAQAAGVDLVYVAAEPDAPRGEAIVVPHDSPIRTLADLRGKRVALNKGSNVHYLLLKALQQAKLGYHDIDAVYLAPADARAAFANGSVDAWVIWDPYLAAVEHQLGARTLVNGEGLVRNVEYYVARRPFADAHPAVIRAALDTLAQIDAWAERNPAAVAAQLAPLTGLDAATLEVALRRTGYGIQPVDANRFAYQQQIANAFSELKLIPKPLTVTDLRWQTD